MLMFSVMVFGFLLVEWLAIKCIFLNFPHLTSLGLHQLCLLKVIFEMRLKQLLLRERQLLSLILGWVGGYERH